MDVVMTPITELAPVIQKQPAVPIPDVARQDLRTDAIYVVYTSTESTFAALRVASGFATALNIPLILVHYWTVPYPLPVDGPTGISPIQTEAFQNRLRAERLDVRCQVYLCRDERRAIAQAVGRPSLIVLGGRRRWWPTRTDSWRRQLEAAGHFVVFVEETSHA
jgi:hypothetical protein